MKKSRTLANKSKIRSSLSIRRRTIRKQLNSNMVQRNSAFRMTLLKDAELPNDGLTLNSDTLSTAPHSKKTI